MTMRKLIYSPSGRAGEYAAKGYAANLYKGCTHGCLYCYVPLFLKMSPEQKKQFSSKVTPAPDVLPRLQADVKRMGKLESPIFLCFTCDPYPEEDLLALHTRDAINVIMDAGNAVNILTKAGTRACVDFDLLAMDKRNKIGATLTFFDDALSKKWEPRASLPKNRIDMLRRAKDEGIATWASIEPVIIPDQSLEIMEAAAPYVDEFKIGKWNHSYDAKKIDWRKFYMDAVLLMNYHEKKHVIKQDLLTAAEAQE